MEEEEEEEVEEEEKEKEKGEQEETERGEGLAGGQGWQRLGHSMLLVSRKGRLIVCSWYQ
jgi:hypothetical protein